MLRRNGATGALPPGTVARERSKEPGCVRNSSRWSLPMTTSGFCCAGTVGVAVGVREGVAVTSGVLVGVTVAVASGVPVTVEVAMAVGVTVAFGGEVGVVCETTGATKKEESRFCCIGFIVGGSALGNNLETVDADTVLDDSGGFGGCCGGMKCPPDPFTGEPCWRNFCNVKLAAGIVGCPAA